MYIKPSASLRNEYTSISDLAKKTGEPIYITKNGEGDLVIMSIDAFEKREELLQLRMSILEAEQERLSGAKGYTSDEMLSQLKARIYEK